MASKQSNNSAGQSGLNSMNNNKDSVGTGKTQNATMTKNITQMVIASLFISILCQVPYSVIFVLGWFGVKSPLYDTVNIVSVFLILLGPCLDFFTYYLFNKLFKGVIDEIILCQ